MVLIALAWVFVAPPLQQRSAESAPETLEARTRAPQIERSSADTEGAAPRRSLTPDIAAGKVRWLAEFTETGDLFGFVQNALAPALAGDHRAQYLIGQALATCTALVVTVNEHGKETPAQNIEATLSVLPIDNPARALEAERISRCERFFGGSPVSELGAEQQTVGYWLNEALLGREAFSLLDRAMSSAISEVPRSPTELADRRTAVLNDLREALRTGDPAVLYRVAGMFINPSIARDPSSQAAIWFLAACSAGYDCSANNKQIGFGCPSAGTCNGGFTIPDQIQRALPPAEYAAAYAASQEILYKIQAGDLDGLDRYLELRL